MSEKKHEQIYKLGNAMIKCYKDLKHGVGIDKALENSDTEEESSSAMKMLRPTTQATFHKFIDRDNERDLKARKWGPMLMNQTWVNSGDSNSLFK